MRKSTSLLLTALLVSGMAAAQTGDTATSSGKASPGWIGSGHPLYFLETSVVDPVQQAVGLKSAADIAREKAAEAEQAATKGDAKAVQAALQQWNRTRGQVADTEVEQVPRPEELLNSLKERTPDEANQGLTTAINSILNSTSNGVQQAGSSIPILGGNGDDNRPSDDRAGR